MTKDRQIVHHSTKRVQNVKLQGLKIKGFEKDRQPLSTSFILYIYIMLFQKQGAVKPCCADYQGSTSEVLVATTFMSQ